MNWGRIGMSLAWIIPLLGLLAFGLTRDPRVLPSPMPGQPAPEFRLAVMEHRESPELQLDSAALVQHRGEVVVVNFWASWCLPCRQEHGALSRVATMFEDRGVQFYGILYNDSHRNALRWLREMGGQSYPALDDPGAGTAISYGLYGVPETFVIGRDGRVAFKQIGPITEEILIDWLESALAAEAEGDA
jgi:cytochrome c biogenesis protein CcmG, thiol:disulfide interchange protein DsbE